jgi:tetratricopeptide (TPR) repeat protein
MMRIVSRVLACLLFLGVTGAAPSARAQESDKERSQKAYEAGRKAYNLGEFDEAVKLWRQGYEVKGDPIFLFNIAQAYRQLKDYQKAIFYYKGYLREQPSATNRADVEAKISELQKLLDASQNATEGPPKGIATPEGKGTEGTTGKTTGETGGKTGTGTGEGGARTGGAKGTDLRGAGAGPRDEGGPGPGKMMKIAGLATGGAGAVLVVTGIIFASKASSIASDLEASTRAGEPWSQAKSDQESSGRTDATIGAVTMTLGVVAVVGGGVLYFLGTQQTARRAERDTAGLQVVPQVGPQAAGVTFRWRY